MFGHSAGVFASSNHSANRSATRHGAPEPGNRPRMVTPLPSPLLGGALVSSVLCLPSLVVVTVCCWWLLLVALYDDLRQVAGVCDMVWYYITFNRARNKRARTRGSGNAYKALSRVPALCWRRFGCVGGWLSRKYIKARGGALKCDYDSLALFGAGGRDQKKAAPAARIPPGLLFLLPVWLSPPRRRCRAGSAPGWRGL